MQWSEEGVLYGIKNLDALIKERRIGGVRVQRGQPTNEGEEVLRSADRSASLR